MGYALIRKAIAVVALALLLPHGAQAALNLNLGLPDILSSFINVAYDANTDTLTASGFASTITQDGVTQLPIAGGTFDINATVDATGTASGGTLAIGGTVAALGFNSGTLLTGTLSQFMDAPGGILEFVFDVTGGDAAADYGSHAGVILSQTGFPGSWTNSWASNPFAAQSDTGPLAVPAPATWLIFGPALIAMGAAMRRRQPAGSSL